MYLHVYHCIEDDMGNCGLTAVFSMEMRFSGPSFPLLKM